MTQLVLAYPILAAMVAVAGAWAVVETAGAMTPRRARVRARPRR